MHVDDKWFCRDSCGRKYISRPRVKRIRCALSRRVISIKHLMTSKIDLPVTIPNIISNNIIFPLPILLDPISGSVIYNFRRKFDPESHRGPLEDDLRAHLVHSWCISLSARVCIDYEH